MSQLTVLEIHPDIVLKGDLSMAKDVVLTGKFEGSLKTLGRLTVAEGGVLVGSIEAGSLILEPGNQVAAKVKVTPAVHVPVEEKRKQAAPVVETKWPGSLRKLKELALGRSK